MLFVLTSDIIENVFSLFYVYPWKAGPRVFLIRRYQNGRKIIVEWKVPSLKLVIVNTRMPCGYWTVLIISLQPLSLESLVDLIPTDNTPTNPLILSHVPLFMISMFHDIVFLDPIVFHDFVPHFSFNLAALT